MSLMAFVPSVFTLANLSAGMLAVLMACGGRPLLAAWLVVLAVLCDGLDGRLARRLKCTSEFGKQLDSLADLVSFCTAPAVFFYVLTLYNLGAAGELVAVFYVLCGAWRLARFNVLNIKDYFLGMPTTAAGLICALVALIFPYISPSISLLLLLGLALLMISSLRFPKI